MDGGEGLWTLGVTAGDCDRLQVGLGVGLREPGEGVGDSVGCWDLESVPLGEQLAVWV